MPSQEQLIKQLLQTIDTATEGFNSKIPSLQQAIFDDIILLVKDLQISSDGVIKNSVQNLKTIGRIKAKIEKIVLNEEYLKEVSKFVEAFDTVAQIQNEYFKLIEKKFSPSKLLKEIQRQSIDSAIESLTESGLDYNVTGAIKEILRTNITSGGSYKDLTNQLRQSVVGAKPGAGILERYMSKAVIDSIQQFNAQYSHAIADDLGLNYYMYIGSLIETSRCFCKALIKKKFIHKSEIPRIVSGDFEEFKEMKCTIYSKTDLPQGMIEGTNASNFPIRRGGHRCGHQLAPVSSAVIPNAIRAKFE